MLAMDYMAAVEEIAARCNAGSSFDEKQAEDQFAEYLSALGLTEAERGPFQQYFNAVVETTKKWNREPAVQVNIADDIYLQVTRHPARGDKQHGTL